eukprot:750249-Hanusia_phi.AAC.4
MLRKEKKEAKLKKGTAETPEGDLIKVKSPNFLPLARECDLGHPVYVFRLRILHVQQSGETTESLAEEPSYLNRELFRDIAVQESAGIFEFAQIISHAFDFDFDDDFTFYRRKNTSRCPGSYSVLLLLPSVMSGAGAEAAARCVEEGTRKPGDTAPGSNEFCIDPTRFEEDFDPVIHVSGQITKVLAPRAMRGRMRAVMEAGREGEEVRDRGEGEKDTGRGKGEVVGRKGEGGEEAR